MLGSPRVTNCDWPLSSARCGRAGPSCTRSRVCAWRTPTSSISCPRATCACWTFARRCCGGARPVARWTVAGGEGRRSWCAPPPQQRGCRQICTLQRTLRQVRRGQEHCSEVLFQLRCVLPPSSPHSSVCRLTRCALRARPASLPSASAQCGNTKRAWACCVTMRAPPRTWGWVDAAAARWQRWTSGWASMRPPLPRRRRRRAWGT
jgi:hypothetical protein